eukprot:6401839-Amphidinium_carterae.1
MSSDHVQKTWHMFPSPSSGVRTEGFGWDHVFSAAIPSATTRFRSNDTSGRGGRTSRTCALHGTVVPPWWQTGSSLSAEVGTTHRCWTCVHVLLLEVAKTESWLPPRRAMLRKAVV